MVLDGHDMTKEEKSEARKPWCLSPIIKLVGHNIGCQFLILRLQSMWRTQHAFTLIDLSNDFFISCFTNKQDYKVALLNVPWLISDHYLHVQCWVPNFMSKTAKIDFLLVWVRFSVLPIEYYTGKWLKRAWNKIGCTIKVDKTTLLASRDKFVRVCIEIDLIKLLKAGYKLRRVLQEIQYEDLHELCFQRGRYGRRLNIRPARTQLQIPNGEKRSAEETTTPSTWSGTTVPTKATVEQRESTYGSWMIVKKPRRRPPK